MSEGSQASSAATPQGPASVPGNDSGNASNAPQTSPEPAPKRYKVVVDGRETEVDHDELIKGYGHNKAANEKMRQAAELQKQVNQFLNELKENPRAVDKLLKQVGSQKDFDTLAHEHVMEKLKYEMMTPEERDRYDFEQKRTAWEKERDSEKAQKTEKDLQAYKDQVSQKTEGDMLEFYQGLGEVPNPQLVGRAIEYMIAAHDARRPITIQRAHELATKDFSHLETSVFDTKLQKMIASGQIPPELAKAVRAADTKAMRGEPIGSVSQRSEPQRPKGQKPPSIDDWFSQRRN